MKKCKLKNEKIFNFIYTIPKHEQGKNTKQLYETHK